MLLLARLRTYSSLYALMFHTKYSVKAYLLTLVTVVTIGSSYAAQDPTVLDYIASLQTNSPNLPNLPNQKGQF